MPAIEKDSLFVSGFFQESTEIIFSFFADNKQAKTE